LIACVSNDVTDGVAQKKENAKQEQLGRSRFEPNIVPHSKQHNANSDIEQ